MIERLQIRLERWYTHLDRRLGGRLSLLVRSALAFDQDDGPLMARSIAYYALFAVFPAILVLIVVASTVLNSEEVQEAVMALVARYMPIARDVVAANIGHLLKTRETVGPVALVGLIWSASGVFSAVFRAVNRAWGIPKSKLVLSEKLYGLVMMFAIGTFLLLALSIGPVLSLARIWQVPVLGWQPAAALAAQPGTDRQQRRPDLGSGQAALYLVREQLYHLQRDLWPRGSHHCFLLWSYLSAQSL